MTQVERILPPLSIYNKAASFTYQIGSEAPFLYKLSSSPPVVKSMADYKPNAVPPMATGYPAGAPPMPMPGFQPQAPAQWSTGLCGCFDDCGNCCLTFWCPCITFGRIAEIVDRGSTSCGTSGALYALIAALTGCQCLYSCAYRSKLRALYGLPESPCCDCLVHWCCETCALCQAYRELQNRGFNMPLGWHGNMERMQGVGMIHPPPVQGGMMR